MTTYLSADERKRAMTLTIDVGLTVVQAQAMIAELRTLVDQTLEQTLDQPRNQPSIQICPTITQRLRQSADHLHALGYHNLALAVAAIAEEHEAQP